MGVAVSTKFFKRGRLDKKVGNHCSRTSRDIVNLFRAVIGENKSHPYLQL